jgi:23S rRNA U2552 (ribose-2'-O)-methylase RlmE/FtsJ
MLSETDLQDVLLSVLTGAADPARQTLFAADLTDDERARLLEALDGREPSEVAQALGDALHLMRADRDLVNECYRAAFYAGPASAQMADNPLFAYFVSRRSGRPLDKWVHYFPVYHEVLAPYRGQSVKVLEIGTFHGGGLDLLSHYLGPQAQVFGMDIQMGSERVGEPHTVIVGDQSDPDWLQRMSEAFGPFDIVIDDGGHTMKQQIVSAEILFPLLNDAGIYIAEDCHTSYWEEFQDAEQTFLDWVRDRFDDVNAVHVDGREFSVWSDHLDSITVADSVVVLRKKHRFRPFSEVVGDNEFLLRSRLQASALIALRTIRDRANFDLAQEVSQAQEDLAQTRGELDRTMGQLASVQAQLETMRASRSWRMTSGLRKVRGHEQ